MRPIKFVVLACLAPAAAAKADVHAEYAAENGRGSMAIDVADNGDTRISLQAGGYMLFTTAGDYDVEPGPGGPVATTLEALRYEFGHDAEEVVADPGTETASYHLTASGTVKVGERSGLAFRLADKNGQQAGPPAVVIADDPRLAPLGKAYLHMLRFAEGTAGAPDELVNEMAAQLEKGGPLALNGLALSSVSFEPLPPAYFAPPGEVTTLADMKERGSADDAGTEAAGPSIRRARFSDGAVWTLDTSGAVARVAEGGTKLEAVEAPGKGVDLCKSPGGLWLFTQASKGAPVQLWARNEAGWIGQGQFSATPPSPLLGVECSDEKPLLLFADRLIDSSDGHTIKLGKQWQPQFGEATLLRQGGVLYVGMNAGEWGGGLRRIDLASGTAALVQEGKIQDLCGGILNAACDPVTGLAADPASSGCVLVATGLVHLLSSGEVDRVCGTSVERVYRKPYTLDPHWTKQDADKSLSTVPFFAMTGGAGGVWAVAPDGLYRFGDGDTPEFYRFTKGGARSQIDWSHPGLVLVPTDMNRRYSLSGASLLLVGR